MKNYTPVIGLEVHVELSTKSKMFCGCSADYFGKKPNSHTCPVCLGLPGALPVPNKKAIEWCIKIALSLNCKINEFSKFDRKNYFYPDLAKGYQISQYDLPFGYKGSVNLKNKRIGITRVHMEEDTGKLLHQGESSLIDFNRSGVPLVEIVTEPDFESAEEVVEYLQKLQRIIRYLDVSDADMEKGEMRLEPNISLRKKAKIELPNYKVEVKNINSFKFVQKAVDYEIKRQSEILDDNKTPSQETRGWNEARQKTISQRSKEEAHDYRYFPEPDIPPIIHTKNQVSTLRKEVPELQYEKIKRFRADFHISEYDAEILTREKTLADYYEETVEIGKDHKIDPKKIANTIINRKIDTRSTLPASLIKTIAASTQTVAINEEEIAGIIKEVLSENKKAVAEYNSGKENVIMFLLGQTMKKINMKVDVNKVKGKLIEKIKN